MTLSRSMFNAFAECHYAECHYAERRGAIILALKTCPVQTLQLIFGPAVSDVKKSFKRRTPGKVLMKFQLVAWKAASSWRTSLTAPRVKAIGK